METPEGKFEIVYKCKRCGVFVFFKDKITTAINPLNILGGIIHQCIPEQPELKSSQFGILEYVGYNRI